ncbi:Imm21 family immunity protein [Streptomyces sirii]|uniref:Imm21 family immunity protein n=1 Tax=Streptomyces sirii TaxID=3127701 RepID=UPI003D36F41B
MSSSTTAGSTASSPTWVESMGGPLIAVPVSALARWRGCTESGMVVGGGDVRDDYDRACEVEGLAGVISIGEEGAQGLVLADEPASSCYLPELQAFVRWLGADCEGDLIAAAEAVLADPTTEWEESGVRDRGSCASAGHRHRGGPGPDLAGGDLTDPAYRLLPA